MSAAGTISRAFKTELAPTPEQTEAFVHHSDVTRFVWNWVLGKRIEHYEKTGESLKSGDLLKEFRSIRERVWPWTIGVASRVEETALRNLDKAYKNFFEKRGRFPKFKSRKRGTVAFTFWGLKPKDITEGAVRLSKIGWVATKETGYLPQGEAVKLNSATVSERAGRWFISVQADVPHEAQKATGEAIGVDLGISRIAIVSDGRQYENPRALDRKARKLRKLSKKLARQQKGSGRREKTKEAIARLHWRTDNVRKAALHQASHDIAGNGNASADRPAVIILEDLNVKGMLSNRHIARAAFDASMSELGRQIRYKAQWGGSDIMEADRWYASSKTCSRCGFIVGDLKLSDRTFRCPKCGNELDRDLNAAVNLRHLAVKPAERLNAHGPVTGRGQAQAEPQAVT